MDTPVIYLNNAATSWPKPPEVLDTVRELLNQPFSDSGRSAPGMTTDCIAEARSEVARFFRAPEVDHVIFCASATDAINILIQGFAKKQSAPFHVLITELDHNSVIRPLRALETEGRCSITVVPCTGTSIALSSVAGAIRPDTRLVVMAHGSNVLGSVQDICTIGRYLQEQGIFFIVDGAQTAGLIPIDLAHLPVDAFVFTGHKYLFGLPGIGGFFIRDPALIDVTRYGGTGTDSRSSRHPETMPEKFEAGTHNYPGIISLAAGIRFLERTGSDAIITSTHNNNAEFLKKICCNDMFEVYNTEPELPVISFNIKAIENDDAGFILRNMYGIVTRTGLHCAPLIHESINGCRGCIRLSPSVLTPAEDCERAADIICEVAERANNR